MADLRIQSGGLAVAAAAVAHLPNRMPFSGVVTKVGSPSDRPPHGSGGHLVMITHAAAAASVHTLVGMAVNADMSLGDHDVKAKLGVITAARVVGDEILAEGLLYDKDFPKETADIKARKDELGMSFEASRIVVTDKTADPWEITDLVFTGAAILLKNKAAYETTSLAAAAQGDKHVPMTKEEMEALGAIIGGSVTKALEPVTAGITALRASAEEAKKAAPTTVRASAETMSMVEPHAAKLEACADGMQASGIGMAPNRGHVAVLRSMAGGLRASAALGSIPSIHRDHGWLMGSASEAGLKASADIDVKASVEYKDLEAKLTKANADLASANTKVEDLTLQARGAVVQPERKTLSQRETVQVDSIMARAGLEKPGEGKKLDPRGVSAALTKAGVVGQAAIAAKAELHRAGYLD